MSALWSKVLNRLVRHFGYSLAPYRPGDTQFPPDFDEGDIATIKQVQPYTRAGPERLLALIHAARYISANAIPGDVVECGTWRGGSAMATLLALMESSEQRDVWLYDTFEGMTPPTDADVEYRGTKAEALLKAAEREPGGGVWCWADIEDVSANVASTGYGMDRVHFVKGDILNTVPVQAPERIALLHLDTDWYESTRHELVHLFPRLSPGGVLAIDDYGHWQGARKAVDEYFRHHGICPLLHRTDYTGRLMVKGGVR